MLRTEWLLAARRSHWHIFGTSVVLLDSVMQDVKTAALGCGAMALPRWIMLPRWMDSKWMLVGSNCGRLAAALRSVFVAQPAHLRTGDSANTCLVRVVLCAWLPVNMAALT